MRYFHTPLMVPEILEALAPRPSALIADGTTGGGGHVEALLQSGATVLGLDRDREAISYAQQRLPYWTASRNGDQPRLQFAFGNFRNLDAIMHEKRIDGFDGLLLDLGVSSMQINEPSRGFSFQKEGPLDMRMSRDSGPSVADFINIADADSIAEVIVSFGEETPRIARQISLAIVEQREQFGVFTTTKQLADLVESKIGKRGKRHPATRVFQALRIAANDELGALTDVLKIAAGVLKPGGRLAIISFHSLEDEKIKSFFHDSNACDESNSQSSPGRELSETRLVGIAQVTPSPYECQINPRARSARLRTYQRAQ